MGSENLDHAGLESKQALRGLSGRFRVGRYLMKMWIRWQGLAVFLGVVIIFSLFWFLLIDGLVERMIEKSGTKAVGAKVELDKADLSIFPAGLKLIRLQIANPDKPMTNAVEIGQINLSLETLNLLRRKIIIKEMTADGKGSRGLPIRMGITK